MLPVTRGEIKERIKAKKNKTQRCQSRINQYQQNHTFKNNQGKFYRDLKREGRNYEMADVPDKKEAQELWKDVEWLENFKKDFENKEEQEEVEVTQEKIKKILRKIPN